MRPDLIGIPIADLRRIVLHHSPDEKHEMHLSTAIPPHAEREEYNNNGMGYNRGI